MGLGLTECEPRKISRFDCIHIVDMITSFFCVERGKSNKCRKSVHTHMEKVTRTYTNNTNSLSLHGYVLFSIFFRFFVRSYLISSAI